MSDPHIVKSLQWRLDRALGKVDALGWQLTEAQARIDFLEAQNQSLVEANDEMHQDVMETSRQLETTTSQLADMKRKVAEAVWRVDKWHTPFEGTYPEATSIRRALKQLGITPDLIEK